MADFSSLKQIIQSYVKQNGNEEITGNILQDVLLAMVSTMGDSAINALASALQDEITARQNQDGTLQGNINAEATARQNQDGTLQGNINAEATARQNQDATLQGNINAEATARQQADTALGGRIDGLQTVINGINTKLAEGYIYAGIATPSTNPGTPSGKVFYIAVSSGTYTNFSNLTAAQGINILKYNGSAWSKDVVYTVDARPKKNSQNFVTSGGIFDNMGALDVSELNATENPHTPALYADLSAALAAIPTDYQKGGMSVKFVQSSDNKYVQYRLMTSSFSTTESDWQGVVNEPNLGSNSLVNSNGIANDLAIKQKVAITGTYVGYEFSLEECLNGRNVLIELLNASSYLYDVYLKNSNDETILIASNVATSFNFTYNSENGYSILRIYLKQNTNGTDIQVSIPNSIDLLNNKFDLKCAGIVELVKKRVSNSIPSQLPAAVLVDISDCIDGGDVKVSLKNSTSSKWSLFLCNPNNIDDNIELADNYTLNEFTFRYTNPSYSLFRAYISRATNATELLLSAIYDLDKLNKSINEKFEEASLETNGKIANINRNLEALKYNIEAEPPVAYTAKQINIDKIQKGTTITLDFVSATRLKYNLYVTNEDGTEGVLIEENITNNLYSFIYNSNYNYIRVYPSIIQDCTSLIISGFADIDKCITKLDVLTEDAQSLRERVNIIEDNVYDVGYSTIRPEDFTGATLAEKVINANNFIKQANGKFIFEFSQNSEYVVTQAIELPSNTNLVVDGCKIKLADGVFDNTVRTANIILNQTDEYDSATITDYVENIRIIGKNGGIIAGTDVLKNAPNPGTGEHGGEYEDWVGDRYGWRGHCIVIAVTHDFELANIKIEKPACYCIMVSNGCYNGKIHDIEFNSTRSNGDGCEISNGCRNLEIYNLSGITSDDTCGASTVDNGRWANGRMVYYLYPLIPLEYDDYRFGGDIYNISVHDIETQSRYHQLMFNAMTKEVYNITCQNIKEVLQSPPSWKNSIVQVYGTLYGTGYSDGLLHNISINGIEAPGAVAPIAFEGGMFHDSWLNKLIKHSAENWYINNSSVSPETANCKITNLIQGT